MSWNSFEPLEFRRLLSGNVTAELVGGELIITGDALRNRIQIVGEANAPASLAISSADDTTTINGSTDTVSFADIEHLTISMGALSDVVTIIDLGIDGNVVADLGQGDDLFHATRLSAGGKLSVEAGLGSDRILLAAVTVDGLTGLSGGAGLDVIALAETHHEGRLRLLGGDDNDTISQTRSSYPGNSEFNAGRGDDAILLGSQVLKFDFNTQGRPGWRTGAADWDNSQRDDYQFNIDLAPLPAQVKPGEQAFLLSANNASDDVFTFIHRHLSAPFELQSGRTYIAMLILDFASNAPSGAAGIGGAPGESVYLKAGITNIQPGIDPAQQANNGLNVDHGQQSQGGDAASVVSNIANGLNVDDFASLDDVPYVQIHRPHVHPVEVQTSGDGKLYFIGGYESGFEGTTAIYIRRVQIVLVPVPQPTV